MDDVPPDVSGEDRPLPAGGFAAWSSGIQQVLRGGQDADVPCGGCTACCRSSQFVHIAPDETDTLAVVPRELQFPAPGLPGHVLLGYDERGHCPMLVDGGCSIYDNRPRTCRTYDCRIFPATGVAPDADKPAIARQARRWRFDLGTDADRVEHEAVQAAARFVNDRGDVVADDERPGNATQHAVLVLRTHAERPPESDDRPTTQG
jgi:Fe-S-cluster containining protein